ncbi:hypothetical protein K466DRAFT_379854 [Polyporus arcularius HHB13444]|uniref:Uncharacterized protein n=1 Tax=Polyporus arcularius HHB13444 TaxID=1314778 RepID=A0A5C3NVU5_9APHY|nr:hypothetical protein K466DRAFT_379854 [Polyporus arcularius HHB13444]
MPPKAHSKQPAQTTPAGRKLRQKSAPKQPLPVGDRLKRLFTSLCARRARRRARKWTEASSTWRRNWRIGRRLTRQPAICTPSCWTPRNR